MILYISYDGMLEPLGESQVLAYLERVEGRRFLLISFEKPDDWADLSRREAMRERMKSLGILWYPLRYHRRPVLPATGFDLLSGVLLGLALWMRFRYRVVHARSYVAGAMGLVLRKLLPVKLIFDMRGFWPDERADTGQWSRGSRLYRGLKSLENALLRSSDAVVSLTEAAVREMRSWPAARKARFTVIPTCTDLELFRPGTPREPFLLGYVGNTRTSYSFETVVRAFRALKKLRPEAQLLVLTRDPKGPLETALSEFQGSFSIRPSSRAETAELMASMHATVFFIHPTFAKIASAPTKLGEFLASGVPALTNKGVGDVDSLLDGTGVLVDSMNENLEAPVSALVALAESRVARERCRSVAEKHFRLSDGAAAYSRLYSELAP